MVFFIQALILGELSSFLCAVKAVLKKDNFIEFYYLVAVETAHSLEGVLKPFFKRLA